MQTCTQARRMEHATARQDSTGDADARTLYGDRPPMIGPRADRQSGDHEASQFVECGRDGMATVRLSLSKLPATSADALDSDVGHASTSLAKTVPMRAYQTLRRPPRTPQIPQYVESARQRVQPSV